MTPHNAFEQTEFMILSFSLFFIHLFFDRTHIFILYEYTKYKIKLITLRVQSKKFVGSTANLIMSKLDKYCMCLAATTTLKHNEINGMINKLDAF